MILNALFNGLLNRRYQIRISSYFIMICILMISGLVLGQKKSLTDYENQLSKLPKSSQKVQTLIEYSREMHRQKHNEVKEYKLAFDATELALEINDTLLYAKALDNLGLLYRYHQRYSQAIPFHLKAYKLVAEKNKVESIHKMIFANNVGVAARYNQQYDLSVEYYLKALKLAVNENNIKNISISSNGLGNALINIPGREDEALKYFKQALGSERERNDSLGIAMDLLSIGDYYIVQKQFHTAFNYLDTLYTINSARKDTFGLAMTHQMFGIAYLKEGKDLQKAKNHYLQSLNFFQRLKNSDKEAEILRELGNFYVETHQSDVAIDYFLNSLNISKKNNNKKLLLDNSYSISQIKEKQKKFDEALFYFKKGKSYEDSIALSNQEVKIAALTSQYQLDQKEDKITNLVEENLYKDHMVETQKEKIENHKVITIILIIFTLLVLVSLFFHYRTAQIKNLAILNLHEKQEELLRTKYEKNIVQAEMLAARSQLNPHFLFNCFTGIHLLIQKGEYKKADQYLIVLSRFLRMILELPKSHSISLNEELKLINYYISLEEKRFDGEFQFNLETISPEEMEEIQIPPLLLQPFVENAIWHGLLPSQKKKKKLDILIQRKNSDVAIIIEDDGVGRNNPSEMYLSSAAIKHGKKSMGMKITQDRIVQFNKSYKSKIQFLIEDKKCPVTGASQGTKVIMTLKDCLSLA